MKTLHWIIFSLAAWIILAPFIGDELIALILGQEIYAEIDLVALLRLDDFFMGLTIFVLALVAVNMEQASHKTPGLKAMHYLQVVLGAWIAIAPFALDLDYEAFTWSHFVAGGFVAVFALLQITYEHRK
jgi:hypothetical protein